MNSLTHTGYAFAGNPLRVQCTGLGGSRNSYKITVGGDEIYSGRFSGNSLDVDVSKIIAPALRRAPWIKPGNDELIPIMTESDFDRWLVVATLFNEEGDEEDYGSAYVLPGGISKYLQRNLQQPADIFGDRFLRPGNLFFTTRSSSSVITIPETELAPLCFLSRFTSNELEMPIAIRSRNGHELLTSTDTHGIWALNLPAIRYRFWDESDVLPSVLDIYIRDKYCATVVLEQAPAAKERCRLRFRNSFGFFDIVDLYGGIQTNCFSNDDDNSSEYLKYDDVVGDYVSRRDRLDCPMSFVVNSGTQRHDRLSLLLDAICSDEVYLLDVFDFPVRVIPSCDALALPWRFRSPQSLNITLTVVESDRFIMPTDVTFDNGRLFTPPFEQKFK